MLGRVFEKFHQNIQYFAKIKKDFFVSPLPMLNEDCVGLKKREITTNFYTHSVYCLYINIFSFLLIHYGTIWSCFSGVSRAGPLPAR